MPDRWQVLFLFACLFKARPRLEDVRQAEAALDVESLVQKALADETWVRVKSTDPTRI